MDSKAKTVEEALGPLLTRACFFCVTTQVSAFANHHSTSLFSNNRPAARSTSPFFEGVNLNQNFFRPRR
jgi:hypothetical protein